MADLIHTVGRNVSNVASLLAAALIFEIIAMSDRFYHMLHDSIQLIVQVEHEEPHSQALHAKEEESLGTRLEHNYVIVELFLGKSVS